MATSPVHLTVAVERIANGMFTATNGRGGQIAVGAGGAGDFTPTELLLAAVGGCTAIDVDILTSRRAEPDGEDSCVVTTRGPWSLSFLIWMALLDQPMEVLGPPEFAAAAGTLTGRLSAAIPETPARPWPGRCGV